MPTAIKGRFSCADGAAESSFFAFSASSFSRPIAAGSRESRCDPTFELGHGIFHDALIEVVTAQMGVAAGGKHRKGPVLDLDDGHIKGAAAEVVDEDLLRCFVIQTIATAAAVGSLMMRSTFSLQCGLHPA